MLNFRYADINDLDFLVELRIRDLRLFSNQEILPQTINKIRDFYKTGIINGTCFTLLGFDNELLAASGTLYLYSLMPSNENPSGIMGQLTNIWVDDKYRHQGIASRIVSDLLTKGQGKCGMICLNSSKDAIALYQKLGFKTKERYMIKQWD